MRARVGLQHDATSRSSTASSLVLAEDDGEELDTVAAVAMPPIDVARPLTGRGNTAELLSATAMALEELTARVESAMSVEETQVDHDLLAGDGYESSAVPAETSSSAVGLEELAGVPETRDAIKEESDEDIEITGVHIEPVAKKAPSDMSTDELRQRLADVSQQIKHRRRQPPSPEHVKTMRAHVYTIYSVLTHLLAGCCV